MAEPKVVPKVATTVEWMVASMAVMKVGRKVAMKAERMVD